MRKNTHIITIFFSFFTLILMSSCQKEVYRKKEPILEKQLSNLDFFFENLQEEELYSPSQNDVPLIKNKKYIKIAALFPITGSYKKIGKEMIDTLVFINSKAVNQNLVIHTFDTRSSKTFLPFLYREIEKEDYDLIIGPIFNHETLQLAKESKIPIISLSNDKTIHHPEVLIFGNMQEDAITDTINFFSANGKKNFMAMFASDSHGSRFYKTFKSAVNKSGGNLMRTEFYEEGSNPEDLRKYINKIIHGNTQTFYTAIETGEIVPERKAKEIIKNSDISDPSMLFNIEKNIVEVIYISAEGETLKTIISSLANAIRQQKMQNVVIIVSSPLEAIEDLKNFENIFFYSNNYIGYKAFSKEFRIKNGYAPTKLSSILYDAVLYSTFVNDNIYGKIESKDLKSKYKSFFGLNNSFVIKHDAVKRYGKLMIVQNGKAQEVANLPIKNLVFDPSYKEEENVEDIIYD